MKGLDGTNRQGKQLLLTQAVGFCQCACLCGLFFCACLGRQLLLHGSEVRKAFRAHALFWQIC